MVFLLSNSLTRFTLVQILIWTSVIFAHIIIPKDAGGGLRDEEENLFANGGYDRRRTVTCHFHVLSVYDFGITDRAGQLQRGRPDGRCVGKPMALSSTSG